MGLFDWAKSKGKSFGDEMKKFTNKDFMEAIAAGCALVASADGNISSEEKEKMVGFMQINENLKVFKLNEVIDKFNNFTAHFDFDFNVGKIEAFKAIEKLRGKSEDARMLIAVCISIGSSDGDFDQKEVSTVVEICTRLGLNPNEFGLKPTKKGF